MQRHDSDGADRLNLPFVGIPSFLREDSLLAAHTILEFLGRICDQPRWAAARHARAARREAASRPAGA